MHLGYAFLLEHYGSEARGVIDDALTGTLQERMVAEEVALVIEAGGEVTVG